MKKLTAALALVCALAVAATAAAATSGSGRSAASTSVDAPGIAYGVADDTGKYADDGGAWFNSMLKGANLTEERWTVSWNAGNPTAIGELPFLQRSAPQAQTDGVHVVLALYGRPASAHDASGFCAWAGTVATTVKQAIYDACNGTKQPTTLNGLTFRIDELGWQSDTSKYTQYYHDENVKVVSEQAQADDVRQAVQKYFACDPTVTDVEWFLLVDEPTRDGKDRNGSFIGGGWQSGFLTAGGKGVSTTKLAYAQDAPLFAQGRAACTGRQISWSPSSASTGKGQPKAKPAKKPKKKHKGH